MAAAIQCQLAIKRDAENRERWPLFGTRHGMVAMAMEEFETTAIDGVLLGPIVWALRYSAGEVYLREVETSSISA